jgi:hypothetical protein
MCVHNAYPYLFMTVHQEIPELCFSSLLSICVTTCQSKARRSSGQRLLWK